MLTGIKANGNLFQNPGWGKGLINFLLLWVKKLTLDLSRKKRNLAITIISFSSTLKVILFMSIFMQLLKPKFSVKSITQKRVLLSVSSLYPRAIPPYLNLLLLF